MIRNVRHDNQRPERPRNIWKPKVKVPVASPVSMVLDVCINGLPCKVLIEEEVSALDLEIKNLFGKWDGGCSEEDSEAGSEDGGVRGSLRDSVGSVVDEVLGSGEGEEVTVQCKEDVVSLGQKHQKYGSEGPQESVRGVVNEVVGGLAENEATFNGEEAFGLEAWPMVERGLLRISVGNEEACVTMNKGASHEEEHVVNVVGPLENIHPGSNGEEAKNEAVFNGEEALGLEAWPMVERGLLRIKVSNEEACVTMNEGVSHEEEHVVNVVGPIENIHPGINGGAAENEAALNVEVAHVVEGHIRNVVVVGDEKEGESGSMMACGLPPLNVECSTHIPSIKVGHAKSHHGLNKAISNTWLEEFEESLGGVGALDHEESVGWVGDSVRQGPRLGELEQSGVREVGMGDVASINHGISGEILGHVVVADGGNAQGLVSGQKKGIEGVLLVMEGRV
ncbi:hypothetical protein ACSQ67_018913 [Phaseolus vulgaris]